MANIKHTGKVAPKQKQIKPKEAKKQKDSSQKKQGTKKKKEGYWTRTVQGCNRHGHDAHNCVLDAPCTYKPYRKREGCWPANKGELIEKTRGLAMLKGLARGERFTNKELRRNDKDALVDILGRGARRQERDLAL